MKRVKVVQDSDCHWYVIPGELETQFYELDEAICGENEPTAHEAEEKFIELFSQYITGGDLNNVELYADIP